MRQMIVWRALASAVKFAPEKSFVFAPTATVAVIQPPAPVALVI
jgi:hypothetical protein